MQAYLIIITYDRQNNVIVQATRVVARHGDYLITTSLPGYNYFNTFLMNPYCDISGLYYKHITIVNDDSRVTLQTVASLMNVIDDTS